MNKHNIFKGLIVSWAVKLSKTTPNDILDVNIIASAPTKEMTQYEPNDAFPIFILGKNKIEAINVMLVIQLIKIVRIIYITKQVKIITLSTQKVHKKNKNS